MKQFCCGDVVPGCKAQFQGTNEGEILGKVAVHAQVAHGLKEVPDSLVAQVRQLIRDVPAA